MHTRLQKGSNEIMYMKFLCEFCSAIETLVATITEEKMSHCFYCFYGDLLSATSCHRKICLVGIESPQPIPASSVLHLSVSQGLSLPLICVSGQPQADTPMCVTHSCWMESHVPRAAVSSPGSLGWLWTVSGGDQVWDDSLRTRWLSSAYFPLPFPRSYTLYPNLPSGSDFVTSSAPNPW